MAIVVLVILALSWLVFRPKADDDWLGYVEGETLHIAAPVSGRLLLRPVDRGTDVKVGTLLFSLDPESVDASVNQAEAQLAASSAQANDLGAAKQRQAELDISRANLAAAQAQVAKASNDFNRIAALSDKGFASRTQLDAARAARDGAVAALSQARAQIRSGELTAGREGQIAAAQAGVSGSQAALRGQRKLRSEIAPQSPADGLIEQTYYNPGEWVPANSPVVAVLPHDKRKLRFFVPENKIATIKVGQTIRFTCDGCGDAARQAKISFIAPRSEYTPPVIYSERARAKLVFMVEALLLPSDKPLPLGLPVEVIPQ
jgi:HlyD family secretion protein